MNVSREAVYSALFAQLQTATLDGLSPAFKTASRKFRIWDSVHAGEQPALFLVEQPERVAQPQLGLPKWQMQATAYVYCKHSPDSGSIPGTALNNLRDAVDKAMQGPYPGALQSLGGLIYHAYINGTVWVDVGLKDKDTQSIAVFPITILTGL